MATTQEKLQHAETALYYGNPADAEAIYRKLLTKKPRDVTLLYHLAIAQHKQNRADDARRTLEKALKRAPDFAEAQLSYGLILVDLKRYAEAERAFRTAYQLRPSLQVALSRLGQTLCIQKKYGEALAPLKQALAFKADDKAALACLVEALQNLDLIEEAISANQTLLGFDDTKEVHSKMGNLVYLLYRHNHEAAQKHTQAWLAAHPDNPFAQHVSASILGTAAASRASDDYVKDLFDIFAETFESQLAKIGYRTPEIIAEIMRTDITAEDLVTLDAGCGTGLAAAELRQKSRHLVGVDISAGMLKKAAEKKLYDELVEMELEQFLAEKQSSFDLIVANDVLIYFGDLASVTRLFAAALQPQGRLYFTLEKSTAESDYSLEAHGRYTHNINYIRACLEQAGLTIATLKEDFLRYENRSKVEIFIVGATRLA